MKACTKCGVTRGGDGFHKRPNGTLQSHCKVCANARAQAWRKKNPERARAHDARYASENRPLVNQRKREQRAANPEASRETVRKWRAQNLDRARRASRAWYAANPVRSRAQEAKRRAAKLQAFAAWADTELIQDIYAYARIMREHGVDCHVDHIVPLQGRTVCGLHTHDNLTVLLPEHNQAKSNRLKETT